MTKSPRYYWIRAIVLLLVAVISYSLWLQSEEDSIDDSYHTQMISTHEAKKSKKATKGTLKQRLISSIETHQIKLSGLSSEVMLYQNPTEINDHIDVSSLTPTGPTQNYVLWGKQGQKYSELRVLSRTEDWLQLPKLDYTSYLITKEVNGNHPKPNLKSIIVSN